jgi:hypothetical protein
VIAFVNYLSDSSSGHFLGEISNSLFGLSGSLYAIDERTVYIENYVYTGDDKSEYTQTNS